MLTYDARDTMTDTPHVDTLQDTIADSYENADRFFDNMLVSEIIGTNMHVEAEDEEVYTPMSASELRSLAGNDLFDWLAS